MKSVIWRMWRIWYTIVSLKMEEATWKGMWWPLEVQHGLQSIQFTSVAQLCLTLCDTSLPCPLPTPRACSNSCPSSQWCPPTIPSSVVPSPAFNLSQHQCLFQWVSSSHQVAKVLEFQLQHQSFQWIFRSSVNNQQGNRGLSSVVVGTEFGCQ